MRRSTAAAFGTLIGTAMIVGVRLSVTPVATTAAQAPAAEAAAENSVTLDGPTTKSTRSGTKPSRSDPGPSRSGTRKPSEPDPTESSSRRPSQPSTSKPAESRKTDTPPAGGLTDGTFRGRSVNNPYGTVRVTIKVVQGEITVVDATYPANGLSGSINNSAIPKLKQETLKAQSAKVAAVSGATYTSKSYVSSLQSALDSAKA